MLPVLNPFRSTRLQHAVLTWTIVALTILAVWYFVTRMGRVAPLQAKELVAQGALLVDVRTPEEYASGHLPGALNVPLGDLNRRAHELGPKESVIVLYCASGGRSAAASRALKSMGRTGVYDLGAMSRW